MPTTQGRRQRLPIDEVTKRYYLGFCHPDADWKRCLGHSFPQQDAILSRLVKSLAWTRTASRSSQRFLERFFNTCNPETLRTRE